MLLRLTWTALPAELFSLYAQESVVINYEYLNSDSFKIENRRCSKVFGKRSEYVAYWSRPEIRPLWDLHEAADVKANCSFAAVLNKGRLGTSQDPYGGAVYFHKS